MSTKKNGFVGPHPWQLARDLYARITYSDPEPRRRDKCCWMFKGSRTYGMLHFRGRSYRATHVSFELAVGELIPPDLLLRHTCDNPPCVNPAHLLTGTNLDNKRDEMSRKRTAVGLRNGAYTKPENRPRGIRHRGSTISPETAALIKGCLIRMGRKPGTLASIAAFYRTSYGVVTGIAYRKSWVPVEATEPSVLPPLIARDKYRNLPKNPRSKVLTPEQVAEIRIEYLHTPDEDKRQMKRHFIKKYGISSPTLANVLERRTWKAVAPEIPPVNEYGHGLATLTDPQVRQIRATVAAHPNVKGVAAALARKFCTAKAKITRVVNRDSYRHVLDDPAAALQLDELPMLQLNHFGEDHGNAELNEQKVKDIRRRAKNGEARRALAKEFNVAPSTIGAVVRRKTWTHVKD